MSTESRQLQHASRRTGRFVLATAAVVVFALLLTARAQWWFERTRSAIVRLPDAGSFGLRDGSAVEFLGTQVGTVDDLRIEDSGLLWASIVVREDFARFVREDSTCVIKKKTLDLAGDAYLEISRGTGSTLPTGATMRSEADSGLTDAFRDVVRQLGVELSPAIAAVREAAEGDADLARMLRDPDGQLQRLTATLGSIARQLEAGKGVAGRLIGDESWAADIDHAVRRLTETLDRTHDVVGRLGDGAATTTASVTGFVDRLSEGDRSVTGAIGDLRDLIADSRAVIVDLGRAAAALPEVTATARDEMRALPGLVQRSQETIAELSKLVLAAQRHWLLRSYVEPAAPTERLGSPRSGVRR